MNINTINKNITEISDSFLTNALLKYIKDNKFPKNLVTKKLNLYLESIKRLEKDISVKVKTIEKNIKETLNSNNKLNIENNKKINELKKQLFDL